MNIYESARREMAAYKWLQSERAGFDIGTRAEREWTERYWLCFYRARFVEHLRGEAFYDEFGADCHGLVVERLPVPPDLLDRVLDKVQQGAENLDVIHWAVAERISREPVLQILEALDINSRRLAPPTF